MFFSGDYECEVSSIPPINKLYRYSKQLKTNCTVYIYKQIVQARYTFINQFYTCSIHLKTNCTGAVYIYKQVVQVRYTFINKLYR